MRIARSTAWLLSLFVSISLAACSPQADPRTPHAPLPGLPIGRVAAGQQRALRRDPTTQLRCLDCHGAQGNHPLSADIPRLGGQYDDYLAYALVSYRQRTRVQAVMNLQAAPLTDQDIADLAVYFAAQPSQLQDLSQARRH